MGFSYNGTEICDITVSGLSGRPGLGCSQLCFSVYFQTTQFTPPNIVVRDFSAAVQVETEDGAHGGFLGQAIPEMPWYLSTSPPSGKTGLIFSVKLLDSQLFELEKFRHGRGLKFRFKVAALAEGPNGIWGQHAELIFKANLSDWVIVLNTLQGTSHFVLGISIPCVPNEHVLARAVERLQRARQHLVSGLYDAVVSDCRLAIEAVRMAAGEEDAVKQAIGKSREVRTKIEREHLIVEAARNFTHLAHHEDLGPEIFSRNEATMLLSIATASVANTVTRMSLTEGT